MRVQPPRTRAKGSTITKTGDELSAMLASAEAYTTTDSVEIRKDGGRKLRDAAERFCKALLVRKRLESGDANAAISDYERQTLGGKDGLVQQVVPYLTIDPSHPGKLHTLNDDLNPPSHDDSLAPGIARCFREFAAIQEGLSRIAPNAHSRTSSDRG